MIRPVILDLFCKAGGGARGYYHAGFDIVGVDIEPQPHYPFEFHQADAIEYVLQHGSEFNAIHASPPCQEYSRLRTLKTKKFPDLIRPTREALINTQKPYIIENVPGAPLTDPFMLCGTMFGLRVIRHRLFECSFPLYFAPAMCCHNGKATGNCRGKEKKRGTLSLRDFKFLTVTGHDFLIDEARYAMGIDWMTRDEINQAIPPAYTEFIGSQLLRMMNS